MTAEILAGDCRKTLPGIRDGSVHCCVTSPPYWLLRDYKTDGQIGLERTPKEYVDALVGVFREVRRTLRDDGTLWLNIGDTFESNGGHADSACTDRRGDYMPESVADRPTKSHEYVFLLAKSKRYFYDKEAVSELAQCGSRGSTFDSGKTLAAAEALQPVQRGPRLESDRRNLRDVWTFPSEPFDGAHFAVMPSALARRCILAGTSERGCCPACGAPWSRRAVSQRLVDGAHGHGRISTSRVTTGWKQGCRCHAAEPVPCTVLDPFGGSGTVAEAATTLGRHGILCELNADYIRLAEKRTAQGGLFAQGPGPVPSRGAA